MKVMQQIIAVSILGLTACTAIQVPNTTMKEVYLLNPVNQKCYTGLMDGRHIIKIGPRTWCLFKTMYYLVPGKWVSRGIRKHGQDLCEYSFAETLTRIAGSQQDTPIVLVDVCP